MIRSSDEIIDAARKISGKRGRFRIAVAVANDSDVLGAIKSAYDDGICDALLFGDRGKIEEVAQRDQIDIGKFRIFDQPDDSKAVKGAVGTAARGEADVTMKGFVSTSTLLKGVLDKKFNLRISRTLSHIAVLTIPGRDKLLLASDGGMTVKPTIEQRFDIFKNALAVAEALRIKPFRTAILVGNKDTTNNHLVYESQELLKLIQKENLSDYVLPEPMNLADALTSEVDAVIYGSIEECNLATKSMIIFGKAIFTGVIIGSKIPVSVVSRTDPIIGKKASIALACLVSDYYRRMDEGK
ncbi:MAG: phosphate acyltransferase [candidate division Zixibacteria bacterium]